LTIRRALIPVSLLRRDEKTMLANGLFGKSGRVPLRIRLVTGVLAKRESMLDPCASGDVPKIVQAVNLNT
jgi:hypothetical protein